MSGLAAPREPDRARLLELLEAARVERAELWGQVAALEAERQADAKRLRAAWIGATIAGDYTAAMHLAKAFGLAFPCLDIEAGT